MAILFVFQNRCHRKYSIIYNIACDFLAHTQNCGKNRHFESPEIQGRCFQVYINFTLASSGLLDYLFKMVANEMHDFPNIDDRG